MDDYNELSTVLPSSIYITVQCILTDTVSYLSFHLRIVIATKQTWLQDLLVHANFVGRNYTIL